MNDYYMFDRLQELVGCRTPHNIHPSNNYAFRFAQRSLLDRLFSTAKLKTPETWDQEFCWMLWALLGFIPIIRTDKYGIIPQFGTPGGYGIFYQPVYVQVASGDASLTGTYSIGNNCALWKLTPDYAGLTDIVNLYAEQLALAYAAVYSSLTNSRVAFAIGAKNKGAAHTVKAIYDMVQSGESVIVYRDQDIPKATAEERAKDNDPFFNMSFDVKSNYIVHDLLIDIQTIYANFDREIGVPSSGVEKRERKTNVEIATGNLDGSARARAWFDQARRSLEQVFDVFPELEGHLDFTPVYPSDPETAVEGGSGYVD